VPSFRVHLVDDHERHDTPIDLALVDSYEVNIRPNLASYALQ
jgi:hypothetical protein